MISILPSLILSLPYPLTPSHPIHPLRPYLISRFPVPSSQSPISKEHTFPPLLPPYLIIPHPQVLSQSQSQFQSQFPHPTFFTSPSLSLSFPPSLPQFQSISQSQHPHFPSPPLPPSLLFRRLSFHQINFPNFFFIIHIPIPHPHPHLYSFIDIHRYYSRTYQSWINKYIGR